MQFAFVTDELSPDPREAVETALEWGVCDFEIRNVLGQRFPRLSLAKLDSLVALRDEYAVRYTAVSPGFFKWRHDDEAQNAYAFGDGLLVSIDFMRACAIPLLISFSFDANPGAEEEARQLLGKLADRLDEAGLALAVENETGQTFNTPERIAALLEAIDRANIGANWDLANLKKNAKDGYPDGYALVRPFIRNVHAKDVLVLPDGRTEWVPISDGVCAWAGQVEALIEDRVVEHITIENHCGPPTRVAKHNLDILRRFAGE